MNIHVTTQCPLTLNTVNLSDKHFIKTEVWRTEPNMHDNALHR